MDAGRTWVASTPVQLFRGDYLLGNRSEHETFDVAPDGKRFLMVKNVDMANAPQASIVVVQNWFEELKRLVLTK